MLGCKYHKSAAPSETGPVERSRTEQPDGARRGRSSEGLLTPQGTLTLTPTLVAMLHSKMTVESAGIPLEVELHIAQDFQTELLAKTILLH